MRFLLYPIMLVYTLVLKIRHIMYNWNIFRTESFHLPVICIGNLSFGGTGKTPLIEYITQLLNEEFKVAILSRGYGRKTKGFRLAGKTDTFEQIGDEPKQYTRKFDQVTVAVDEKRVHGIHELLKQSPKPEVILLDDAFQHRAVEAGLNILLSDYHQLYPDDYLFPVGRLRDVHSAAKRADIIIVTKTPKVPSPFIFRKLREIIKPKSYQKLFFSYITYGNLLPVIPTKGFMIPKSIGTIILFCGIANPYPLEDHLRKKCNQLILFDYPDHHAFQEKDIQSILNQYNNLIGKNKIIVTTEKDAMRLTDSPYLRQFDGIPLFYAPITVSFHEEDNLNFDQEIIQYVRKNRANN
ncbi:MAG: tetraacyldisaccharide 4'-kinase [Bacteroidales bacterium]